MTQIFQRILIIAIFTLCSSNLIKAQPSKGEFIEVSVGLGFSIPYDEVNITGNGFYAQGEYVIGLTKWFGIRPYAGLILTSADKGTDEFSQFGYQVTSKAFLLGGKARLAAPIPWVAPYLEIGLGASIGSFKTFTPFDQIQKNGPILHIPFSLGLAIGSRHNIELEFAYYYQSSVDQFSGAAALGFSFPVHL